MMGLEKKWREDVLGQYFKMFLNAAQLIIVK